MYQREKETEPKLKAKISVNSDQIAAWDHLATEINQFTLVSFSTSHLYQTFIYIFPPDLVIFHLI